MLSTENVRSILAFLMAAIFTAVLAILVMRAIPDDNRDFFNIALGALIGSFTGVIGWYFGSSSGSDEKTKIMSETPKVP